MHASRDGWACEKLPKSGAPRQRALLSLYTPAHWVNFVKVISLAFAGYKVSTSTMTVNGFAMNCMDFVAGTTKICTTTQHLLGYVQVAAGSRIGPSAGFEITSYTSSPAASLFKLPAGATVTSSSGT